jgi:hypothetical protein
MLNSDLMSGASLEALAVLLVSTHALAECMFGENLRVQNGPADVGAAAVTRVLAVETAVHAARASEDAPRPGFAATPLSVSARRRAEKFRVRGLSPYLIRRARVRRVIRIRGRR